MVFLQSHVTILALNVGPVGFKENEFKSRVDQGIITFYYSCDQFMEFKCEIGRMLPVRGILLIHPCHEFNSQRVTNHVTSIFLSYDLIFIHDFIVTSLSYRNPFGSPSMIAHLLSIVFTHHYVIRSSATLLHIMLTFRYWLVPLVISYLRSDWTITSYLS